MECKLLMMATSNIFSPSSGKPILTPSQDIVLGTYYLTIEPRKKPEKNQRVPLLSGLSEVFFAKTDGVLKTHDWVDIPNPDFGRQTIYGNKDKRVIRTTVCRSSQSLSRCKNSLSLNIFIRFLSHVVCSLTFFMASRKTISTSSCFPGDPISMKGTGCLSSPIASEVVIQFSELACGIAMGMAVGNPVGNSSSRRMTS